MATHRDIARDARRARDKEELDAYKDFGSKCAALEEELTSQGLTGDAYRAARREGLMSLALDTRRAVNRAKRRNSRGNFLMNQIRKEIAAEKGLA